MSNESTPPPAKNDRLIGTLINGRYKVHAVIASGGMGRIYRAEQLPLGRPAAVKVVQSRAQISEEDQKAFYARFFREASILAKLQHPNIVTIFDYGKIDGTHDGEEAECYFMAMEYLSGETLHRRIRKRGSLSVEESLRIAYEVCRGLRAAHLQGIVHRDLKPANIMLTVGTDGEEQVKVVDFGIVKLLEEGDVGRELTQEGSFLGSPNYIAPEQAAGEAVDGRCDIYSLGVILYHALTGRLPYDAPNTMGMILAHINSPVIPFAERAPELTIPPWVAELVIQCLAKKPADRPGSMDEILRAIYDRSPHSGSGKLPPPVGSSAQLPIITGLTVHDPGTVTSMSAAIGPKRGAVLPVAASLAALLVVGGLALVVVRGAKPRAAAGGPPVTMSAVPPSDSATARATFTVFVDSLPPGAEVAEGEVVLGTTPLQLTFDNSALRGKARRLVVQKGGFYPYSVAQGPSFENVRIVATLVERHEPAAPASTTAAQPPVARTQPRVAPVPVPPPPPPASTRATPSQPLDIQLTR